MDEERDLVELKSVLFTVSHHFSELSILDHIRRMSYIHCTRCRTLAQISASADLLHLAEASATQPVRLAAGNLEAPCGMGYIGKKIKPLDGRNILKIKSGSFSAVSKPNFASKFNSK